MTVTRFQQKRGTSAQWAAWTQPLRDGELGVDKDTGVIKMGDGYTLWAGLPPIMDSQYLPRLGKAADSTLFDGLKSSDYLKKTDGGQFLAATGKAADSAKLGGQDPSYYQKTDDSTYTASLVSAAISAASPTRTLNNHWGSVTSFPITSGGVKIGDTCNRTDIGTNGSIWQYHGSGKGISGWLHKGLLVCTSATRPASASTYYVGLQIFETDTGNAYIRAGSSWNPMVYDSGWVPITMNSPIASNIFQVRKIGSYVHLVLDGAYNGAFAALFSFGVIPVGYRPFIFTYAVGTTYSNGVMPFRIDPSSGSVNYYGPSNTTYNGALLNITYPQGF